MMQQVSSVMSEKCYDMDTAATNTLFLSVPCLKIQYLYIPAQDLASTCMCSLY